MHNQNIHYLYNNNYITTTNGSLTKQHCIVSGSNFPLFIAERFAEIPPPRDPETKAIDINNFPEEALVLFGTNTTLTARRASNHYSISEMKTMADAAPTTAVGGPYIGQLQKVRYGTDIAYEIKDNSDISREIGGIHMVIDNIDMSNNIMAGFGVDVADTALDGSVVAREILYVDNSGKMNVDQITLGMDETNPDNNVLLSAGRGFYYQPLRERDLYINDEPLGKIINDQVSYKLNQRLNQIFQPDTTSETGNLYIVFNGNRYIANFDKHLDQVSLG